MEMSDMDFGDELSVNFEAEGIAKVIDAIAKRTAEGDFPYVRAIDYADGVYANDALSDADFARKNDYVEFQSYLEAKKKGYFERNPGTWITHIEMPDEPVVTGMSGGPVIDIATGEPIGIIITRNSPADLNNDRDPDESCDFIALSAVWDAVRQTQNIA